MATYNNPIKAAMLAIFIISSVHVSTAGAPMRIVKYQQNEFRYDPVDREAILSTFEYDIPYFGACRVFPPRHVINEIFSKGGRDGGMSPGATWTPFQVSEIEYQKLVSTIEKLDPSTLRHNARFTWVKFEFDSAFDNIQDRVMWMKVVCEKHRPEYHLKMSRATGRGE